jgi:hypothetical protein
MTHATAQRRTLYCNGARYIATAHAILQRRTLYCNGARYIATAHAIAKRHNQFSPPEYSCLSGLRILFMAIQFLARFEK